MYICIYVYINEIFFKIKIDFLFCFWWISLNTFFENIFLEKMNIKTEPRDNCKDSCHVKHAFRQFLQYSGLEEKQYQLDAVAWCYHNETRDDLPDNVRGGFIADEMGLGKTIVMIGLLVTHLLPKTLIVVPPVLIDQWYQQILKTTGYAPFIYHGSKRDLCFIHAHTHVVITTYGTISNTSYTSLHDVVWSRIVFDEAHHLRNKKTKVFEGASALKSTIRWLVSGTPVQNNQRDFYNLCSALKIRPRFYKDALNSIFIARNYVLRRTKKDVGIILPEIVYHHHVVPWKHEKEMILAESLHNELYFTVKDCNDKSRNWEKEKEKEEEKDNKKDKENKVTPFCSLNQYLKAKQACVLPCLVEGNENMTCTSKLDYVVDLLIQRRHNQNGKLVFCHFRKEIDEIYRRLCAYDNNNNKNVATFDGRNNREERKQILDSKKQILILQIQTGCEGLNLQEHYNEVYFVSPHWNPAIEDQAVARCHRIGQKKEVHVFRFEMEAFVQSRTIDNYVTSVQDNKRTIADECINSCGGGGVLKRSKFIIEDDDNDDVEEIIVVEE